MHSKIYNLSSFILQEITRELIFLNIEGALQLYRARLPREKENIVNLINIANYINNIQYYSSTAFFTGFLMRNNLPCAVIKMGTFFLAGNKVLIICTAEFPC